MYIITVQNLIVHHNTFSLVVFQRLIDTRLNGQWHSKVELKLTNLSGSAIALSPPVLSSWSRNNFWRDFFPAFSTWVSTASIERQFSFTSPRSSTYLCWKYILVRDLLPMQNNVSTVLHGWTSFLTEKNSRIYLCTQHLKWKTE